MSRGVRFERVAERFNLRVSPQAGSLVRGVCVSPSSFAFLESRGDVLDGRTLLIDPLLRFHDVDKIFGDEQVLRRSIVVHNGSIKIVPTVSLDEFASGVRNSTEYGIDGVLTRLDTLRADLLDLDYAEILRSSALDVLSLFNEEKPSGYDSFERFLGKVSELADHDLNKRIVAELMNGKKHDPVWASVALSFFRTNFPQEISYPLLEGDLSVSIGDYGYAIEMYSLALSLSPKDKAVAKKLKEAQKASQKDIEARARALLERTSALWQKISPDDRESLSAFVQDAIILHRMGKLEYHVKSRLTKNETKQAAMAKLNAVIDYCAAEKREFAQDIFEDIASDFVGEILTLAASGDPSFCLIRDARGNLYQNKVNMDYVRQLVDDYPHEVLFIPQNIMEKIYAASRAEKHPAKEVCTHIMDKYIHSRRVAASRLYNEDKVEEAIVVLREAASMYRDEVIINNLCVMLVRRGAAYKAREEYAQAKAYFEEAFQYDKNYAIAIVNIAEIALYEGDYQRAFDFCQKAIAAQEPKNQNLLDMHKKSVESAHSYMVHSSLRLYETSGFDEKYLKVAEKYIVSAEKYNPKNVLLKYDRVKILLVHQKYDEALAVLEEIFTFPVAIKGESIVYLILALPSLFVGGDTINPPSRKLVKFISDRFIDFMERGTPDMYQTAVSDYADVIAQFGSYLVGMDQSYLDFCFAEAARISLAVIKKASEKEAVMYARYVLGEVEYNRGNYTTAISYLGEILSDANSDFVIRKGSLRLKAGAMLAFSQIALHREALESGNIPEFIAAALIKTQGYLLEDVEKHPEDSEGLRAIGLIYENMGNSDLAKNFYRRSGEKDRDTFKGFQNLLNLLAREGNWEEFERVFNEYSSLVMGIVNSGDKIEGSRISNYDFFSFLMGAYSEHRKDYILRLLSSVLKSTKTMDYKPYFIRALEKVESTGEVIAPEIKELLS